MNLNLKSERLLLRPLAETDRDIRIETLTDPAVMKYALGTLTEDRVVQGMPNAIKRGAGGAIGMWCVTDRSTGEKLGSIMLLPLPIEEEKRNWDLVAGDDLPDGEIEIGYIFKQSAWGKGYATEACKRLLEFAFEEMRLCEVVAVIDSENDASRNVLRKSGLIEEGLRRAYATQCPGFRITRRRWIDWNRAAS